MIKETYFTIGELKAILMEATKEYKPKYGKGVEKEKGENEKAVKKIMDDVEKYNPKQVKRETGLDYGEYLNGNKTTMEPNFRYKPDKDYINRNHALTKGYSSEMEEKNKVEKDPSLEYEGNEKIYDAISDSAKERSKQSAKARHSGLQAREQFSEKECEDNTMFNESKKMKRLSFKRTIFLSESDMLKHIPDEYKRDGNRFSVKDASGTEYIVECKGDKNFNFVKTEVVNKFNDNEINEQLDRMKSLYGYKSSSYTRAKKVGDNYSSVEETINCVRKLNKNMDNLTNGDNR